MNVYVAKKNGPYISEKFDSVKLHASINAACLSVRSFEGEAHMIARSVCEKVLDWLNTKTEVTSEDIRRVAAKYLHIYHPEAAYLYLAYRVML